jgi:hypothetical protein
MSDNCVGRCVACQHWAQGWKYYDSTNNNAVVTSQSYGVCDKMEFAGTVNEVLEGQASIYFGIGDDIHFVTHESFGCTQYEAKQ